MKGKFKNDFIWGAATSAYQIEGAYDVAGKGLSIWDIFAHNTGKIFENQTGDIACDHYHHMEEDVSLMKRIGLNAYRFSISWPRILPEGVGKINQHGVDFYKRLAEELLKNDIEPYATLFHWDFPQVLQNKGGFLSDKSPEWFAYYAEVVAKQLGGMIKNYFTINEPQCFIGGAFNDITFAPGIKTTLNEQMRMSHNVLLAHGKAVQILRKYVPNCKVGYAPTGVFYFPADKSKENIEAARKANFCVNEDNWVSGISWWSDPVILGTYPDECEHLNYILENVIKNGDMDQISQPLDFYGQNIYRGIPVEADGDGYRVIGFKEGWPRTAIGWKVTPDVMYWVPKFLYERYKLPIIITENGISCHDWVSLDGKVHDPNRIDYTHRYLKKLLDVYKDGVDIAGYFHWSLMDNFEWANGYNERFGLIYVDYQSSKRIIKDSGFWYRDVIRYNGNNL